MDINTSFIGEKVREASNFCCQCCDDSEIDIYMMLLVKLLDSLQPISLVFSDDGSGIRSSSFVLYPYPLASRSFQFWLPDTDI
jgi:hypothetical protein